MKLVLSKTTAEDIKTFVEKGRRADDAKGKAIDALYADGIKPEHMLAPKDKDADRSFYASLETAVVSGFTATNQALLKKDVKTLNEKQKGERRYWQQQIPSKIKDMRNSLQRRIDRANADANGDAQTNSSTWESAKRKALTDIIAQAKKKEATTIKDLAKFIQDLESALARIPANA